MIRFQDYERHLNILVSNPEYGAVTARPGKAVESEATAYRRDIILKAGLPERKAGFQGYPPQRMPSVRNNELDGPGLQELAYLR